MNQGRVGGTSSLNMRPTVSTMPIKRLILRSVGKEHGILFDFDENAFIERTQSGDPEAFGPLVVKYHDRLYTHIYGRVKDAETAEDLTQET